MVFIDEADAIFGARTGHHQRTSHRELINQFLKEWDGMAKMSAFIMVATNRPFDLDDAVLRVGLGFIHIRYHILRCADGFHSVYLVES